MTLQLFDRLLDHVLAAAKWLVVPVVLLLCLQWPLRDLVQRYSREANDLGQILFALYVALAVTAATRAGSHICIDALARRYAPATRRRLRRIGNALILMPWAAFIACSARPMVLASVGQLERFQDTLNPGYFVIKIAVWVLAGAVLIAGLVDVLGGDDGPRTSIDR